MKNKHKLFKTMYSRILIPVMIIVILQGVIVSLVLFFGVAKKTLDNTLIDDFKGDVSLSKNFLETSMSNKWHNIDSEYEKIVENTSSFLIEKGITIDELLASKEYSEELMLSQANIMPNIITKNRVTTSFFIIDNQGLYNDDKTSVFLNTKNPNKASNDSIEVLFAPSSTIEYYYKEKFNLYSDVYTYKFSNISNKTFYNKPVELCKESKKTRVKGYWSCDLSIGNYNFLTYTVPLIVDGVIFGALGIGLTTQYLQTTMSVFNKGNNLNIELVRKVNNKYESAFKAYTDYSINYSNVDEYTSTGIEGIYSFECENITEYVCNESINLYSENDYGEEWYILGILPKDEILAASNLIERQVFIIYLIGFLATAVVLFIVIRLISNPIKRVSKSVNEKNINNIPRTNIYEVDVLLEELSLYFEKALVLNKKLDSVIEDANIKIAILEYSKNDNTINTTKKFYTMLGLNYEDVLISLDDFLNRIEMIEKCIVSSLYEYNSFKDELFETTNQYGLLIDNYYLRLKVIVSDEGAIATLLDLTAEYNERTKIEYERDYDILTGLLNRTGLYIRVEKIFSSNNKDGALYMIDIDNLKKINDKYGHQLGDRYISTVGKYLNDLSNKYPNLIASHISGDEFILYLNNPKNNEIIEIAHEIEDIRNVYLECYSGKIYISLSCGVALYEPNISFEELRKRADFAMYTVKNSCKNSIAFFNSQAYELYNKENVMHDKLIKLIDEKLIDYAYQPIVDIKTGEILGYEALMRPLIIEYKSPLKVIEEAKKYNKLYDIEILTLFFSTDKFVKSKSNKKLFINSISSQILSDKLFDKYLTDYKDCLSNIVIEMTEEDFGETDIMTKKISIIRNNNMQYAIDDYGTGFNSIGMILDYSPSYIKIEGSLINGINKDDKKKQFTKSIINICKENNILIIAESVETIEELKCVKELGVDYVQGFLLSKPSLEIKDISDEIKEMIKNS